MSAEVLRHEFPCTPQGPLSPQTVQPFCTCRVSRPPCCCEAVRVDRESPHSQQCCQHYTHWQLEEPHGGKEDSGQVEPQPQSSYRHCLYCVPEQEMLHECEQLEKKRRNRLMRAERQQLKTSLDNTLRRCELSKQKRPQDKSYKTNTAHLLRCFQRPVYQQSIKKEQERRRQELRKEIAERRRELCMRGVLCQPVTAVAPLTRLIRSKMPCKRFPKKGVTEGCLPACPTSGLRQHSQCGRTTRGTTMSTVVSPPFTGDQPDPVAGRGPLLLEDTQKKGACPSTPPPRVDTCRGGELRGCCGCCCHSRVRNVMAATGDKEDSVTSDAAKGNAKSAAAHSRVARQVTHLASPLQRGRLDVCDYGRKVYITDDAYLSWRMKIIEGLEREGFVRPILSTTRSPSAPLPITRKKWATTRSTSAHRV